MSWGESVNLLLEKLKEIPCTEPLLERKYLTYDVFQPRQAPRNRVPVRNIKGLRYCVCSQMSFLVGVNSILQARPGVPRP